MDIFQKCGQRILSFALMINSPIFATITTTYFCITILLADNSTYVPKQKTTRIVTQSERHERKSKIRPVRDEILKQTFS